MAFANPAIEPETKVTFGFSLCGVVGMHIIFNFGIILKTAILAIGCKIKRHLDKKKEPKRSKEDFDILSSSSVESSSVSKTSLSKESPRPTEDSQNKPPKLLNLPPSNPYI
mmetsp:Transcript_39964/g.61144  ORF Transcript_39964/g.61144 Transcript_39964/m.61144 type:complete len:111 (+) Transcript_39964:4350-4682(+)